ncbi:MAG: hypothetical protein ACE5FU_07560 [Nitrospinota bacterium]
MDTAKMWFAKTRNIPAIVSKRNKEESKTIGLRYFSIARAFKKVEML